MVPPGIPTVPPSLLRRTPAAFNIYLRSLITFERGAGQIVWSVQPHARHSPEPVLRPPFNGDWREIPLAWAIYSLAHLFNSVCSEHTGWEWGALGSERRGSKDARSPQPHGRAPIVGERVPTLPLQGLPGKVNYEDSLNKGAQRTLLVTRAWSSLEMWAEILGACSPEHGWWPAGRPCVSPCCVLASGEARCSVDLCYFKPKELLCSGVTKALPKEMKESPSEWLYRVAPS